MQALVIDDSKPVRSILRRMLVELGFEVTLACDGQEALGRLEEHELPDLITVNWNMPVLDGIGFLRAFRSQARYRCVPVVMVSVESDPLKVAEAKAAGANAYLVKPLSAETLVHALRRLGLQPSLKQAESLARRPTSSRPDRQRVLVVDDSVVIRRTLTKVLGEDPEIEVAGTAADGRIALDALPQIAPDVVVLDIEMPNLDGFETLKEIRRTRPELPVIMFSSHTERGAAATLDALLLGADDYVPKPTDVNDFNVAQQCVRDELIPRIKQFARPRCLTAARPGGISPPLGRPASSAETPIDIVVIGVSTGGPVALAQLLPSFARDCPVPIVVVQHMPAVFTRHLAERLAGIHALRVSEGVDGQLLEPGHVVIAPGGHHTVVTRRGRRLQLQLNQDPPENSCRPAADVLFRSAAAACGAGTLGVVLTGMGKDGLRGCEEIVGRGGQVLAQDEASSVVWGMPGQVALAGLADLVLPLDQLPAAISRRVWQKRNRHG